MKIILEEKRTISTLKPVPYEGERYYSQARNKLPGEKGSRFMVLGGKVPLVTPKGEYIREGDSVRQTGPFVEYVVIPPGLYERFSMLHKARNSKDRVFSFIKEWGLLGMGPLKELPSQMGLKGKKHIGPWIPEYPPESINKIIEESKRFSMILSLYAILQRYYREHGILSARDKKRVLKLLEMFQDIPSLNSLPVPTKTELSMKGLTELSIEELIDIIREKVIKRTLEWYTGDLQFTIYFPEGTSILETRILNAGLLNKMYLQFIQNATEGIRFMECSVCGRAMAVYREDKKSHKECGARERGKKFDINLFTKVLTYLRENNKEVSLQNIRQEYLKLRPGKGCSLKRIKNIFEECEIKVEKSGRIPEPGEALKALQERLSD